MYTHDDDMAQGVVQAIRNAGREDEMFLTGVGGSQDAMKQIKEGGLYRATFLYNPNMAGDRREHGAPDRRSARASPSSFRPRFRAGGRARRRCHEGQRRPVREVRVQLSPAPGARRTPKRPAGRTIRSVAYDEELAERIRELVAREPGLTEQKMFGGLAFLIGGNMAIAASGQGGILVRVDPAESDDLVAKTKARLMEMRGRSMQGWLRVDAETFAPRPSSPDGSSSARRMPARYP